MHIDNVVQLIVPLTFVAIWALTAIFNRDAQPLPPRQGRPPGPGGPRIAGGPVANRPLEKRPEGLTREPPLRWSTPPAAPKAAPGGLARGRAFEGRDEDILIIRSEPSLSARTAGARSGGGSPSARRAGRPRPASSPLTQRDEAPRARALGAPPAQDLALPMMKSLELSTQSSPLSALSPEGSIAPVTTSMAAMKLTRSQAPLSLFGIELEQLTASPARLREAVILSELLRPPLALRRPTGARR